MDSRGNHEKYVKIVISIALRWQNGGVWADPPFYGGKTEGFGQILCIRWVLPFYGGPKNPELTVTLFYHSIYLSSNFLGDAETECNACAMGKRGPPLAYAIFSNYFETV